jgi:hypothetical protein
MPANGRCDVIRRLKVKITALNGIYACLYWCYKRFQIIFEVMYELIRCNFRFIYIPKSKVVQKLSRTKIMPHDTCIMEA